MTLRQRFLNKVYPVLINGGKLIRLNNQIIKSHPNIIIPSSFYSLHIKRIDGQDIQFSNFKGKKVLLVNTASDCGYTSQYGELQILQDRFKDKLVIIGFPSNDFKEQEKNNNKEIEKFCSINYGVTFSLAQKSAVLKNNLQNKVFVWLTHEYHNGWNNQTPFWNFTKYLVDENGKLDFIFGPGISPLDKDIVEAIKS